eukprot:4023113-Ditylum_brightwellii.AAC.1
MAKVWNKIGHADKKYKSGSITSLQIPVTWPSSDCDEDQICALLCPGPTFWPPILALPTDIHLI